jgi:hypothetical protein
MHKNPIDRPFRSKDDVEMERALVAQYRALGNSELLDVVGEAPTRPNEDEQLNS